MGVIYFLVCVKRYESNLPTNIYLTVRKKKQKYREKWDLLSETTFLPYFMTAWCVFFSQSVYFFTNGVIIRTFITTLCLCFYDFSKTVLVKKCTPCQGVVWFSPSKCHIFYTSTGFSVVFYVHNWSPLKPQNKLQKKSRALPSSSRRGLRAPDPAKFNPSSEKMTSQPTCFAVRSSPRA